jgi:hypothetical protein
MKWSWKYRLTRATTHVDALHGDAPGVFQRELEGGNQCLAGRQLNARPTTIWGRPKWFPEWPVSDPQLSEFHSCGEPRLPKASHCGHHARRALPLPTPRPRPVLTIVPEEKVPA